MESTKIRLMIRLQILLTGWTGKRMDPKELAREIKKLEKEMFECAKNLEFEKAAAIRDKLSTVKNKFLVLTATTLMKKI